MTIAEAQRFYEKDNHEYEIETNKEFLNWLNNNIKNGYSSFMDLEHIQETIDIIANWYELKYPEREIETNHGTEYFKFQNIENISKHMNYEQLMYRLPHKSLCIMECGYRARGWGCPDRIYMKVDYNGEREYYQFPYELIYANHYSGIIEKISLEALGINIDKEINLDELNEILVKSDREDINYAQITESVENHNIDIKLRKKILELVALKLIYSKNTIPEYGYERAIKFIDEFNESIENLNITSEKIDEIMNMDYSKEINKNDKVLTKIKNKFNLK